MGALLKLVRDVRHVSDLPAALGADPWAAATQPQRRTAEMRQVVVAPLAALVDGGASITHAAQLFLSQAGGGVLPPATAHALAVLASDGSDPAAARGDDVAPGSMAHYAPSLATLKRWISAYRRDGTPGLLPHHTGRVRQAYGWEQRAVALYNTPSKPGYADVAFRLRSEGFPAATESRVKRYLKALPATLGEHSPARVGRHLHRLTRQRFQRRHLDEVLVGEIYAGDGHTVDCYVAHPNTGKPFRPELTLFLDIKSRYPAGWFFTESESGHSTLFALSSALTGHNHVPAWLYIDRGAGYRSQLLSDTNTGWYAKFDIQTIGALPGNPHGKGWIERFFRTCRDRHDKFFFGGQVYCGDDMAEEVNRRLSAELASGRRTLPSFYDYVRSFADFISALVMEPMDVLGGRTPAQLWAELTPVPVELQAEAILRPAEQPTVQRQTVRLHNRFYHHEALALYDGKKLRVEYDLHRDGRVWCYDLAGRYVCEAKLVNTIGVLPTSRLDEQRQRRLQGQVKRLARRIDEARARSNDPVTAETQASAIALLDQTAPPPLPAPTPADDSPAPVIDITDWTDDRRADS
jgi:putative transposase